MIASDLRPPLLMLIDGSGCARDDVGGKAAGLDRLAAHHFPIPLTITLTTQAYRRTVEDAGLAPWLQKLEARPIPEPEWLAAEEAEVVDLFLTAALPRDVEEAIAAAAAAVLASGRAAVRSSATAEDLGVASFAGQYRTFVGLDTTADVTDAVRRCWASLWLPAARQYRMRHGIEEPDLAMAVVVQSMVEADWSGVAFTRDLGGDRELLRVEAVPGMGEALVSGAVTPAGFTVRRRNLEVCTARGGPPPAFLEQLVRMVLRVEEELDAPQDVEWSWADGHIVLLQSRPITVTGQTAALDDGFDRPIGSRDVFTPNGVVEMLPGVVSPLVWSINAPMIEHGLRSVVGRLGGLTIAMSRPFLGRFRGRAALNLSVLRDIAAAMPGGSAADVERQYLGRSLSQEAPRNGWSAGAVRAAIRSRRARAHLADEVDMACVAADGLVALDVDLSSLPAGRLLVYGGVVRDLAWRLVGAEVTAAAAAAADYQAVELFLGRSLEPDDAAVWTQRLTAGALGGHLAGTRLQQELARAWRLHGAGHPELEAAVHAQPESIVGAAVAGLGAPGRGLRRAVAAAARMAGSKAVYAGEAWDEDPEAVWSRLADAVSGVDRTHREVDDEPLLELAGRLTTTRRWRTVRILTGQIVDLRMRWIQRQVEAATASLRLRERAKAALLSLGGEERRILLESARRLASSHHIGCVTDIEMYTDDEVRAMIAGEAPPPAAAVHWRRAVADRCRASGPLPDTFLGEPDATVLPEAVATDTLAGWAASPGRVCRPARIVTSLAEGGALRPGEVLVAQATDPSWTPLLARAAGIVLETGGPLSHGAIVARELGIPAVLSVTAATAVISDGDMVEVDGFAGVVRRSPGAGVEAA
ncbi:MAG TPA: PEP/pyruvate-binding domain-containing protein [Acidimicrobiia bacterium]